jgi:uncharacterized membrane protein
MSNTDRPDDGLREEAARQLKKRRDFNGHLLVYVLVNTFLVTIWFFTSRDGFFWPIFPLVGWGIGVVMNAWDVYARPVREDDIDREVRRLQRHR